MMGICDPTSPCGASISPVLAVCTDTDMMSTGASVPQAMAGVHAYCSTTSTTTASHMTMSEPCSAALMAMPCGSHMDMENLTMMGICDPTSPCGASISPVLAVCTDTDMMSTGASVPQAMAGIHAYCSTTSTTTASPILMSEPCSAALMAMPCGDHMDMENLTMMGICDPTSPCGASISPVLAVCTDTDMMSTGASVPQAMAGVHGYCSNLSKPAPMTCSACTSSDCSTSRRCSRCPICASYRCSFCDNEWKCNKWGGCAGCEQCMVEPTTTTRDPCSYCDSAVKCLMWPRNCGKCSMCLDVKDQTWSALRRVFNEQTYV